LNFNLISKSHSLIQPKKLFLIIIILFGICNVTFSQGRRDRISGNVNYNKVGQTDTSSVISAEDSLKLIEAREPVDSTARLKYFTYEPEYFFGTKVKGRTSPLLLGNSAVLKPEVSFDTSGNVILTENFNGEPIRAPLVIPLDTYLQQLSTKNRENIFSDIVNEYFRGGTQDDLGKLFEKFTDITIPLPFKSESIFGPPTFNLKLNGAVDITASYQSAKSDQTIITGLSNVNNSINFKQEVQLTAKGKVGDKLSIDGVSEEDCLMPMTMYGVNKLYNEHLGRYYSELYKRLSPELETGFIDFRGVRFPGLISAFTVPTGGTSDFAPEMIHKAAQNLPYACFVRADSQIPFMAMPDGVRALMELAAAPASNLTRRIYNIGAFAPTAGEFAELVTAAFPNAQITFEPDVKRQGIIDSWPCDVDDSAARHDWGWMPEYDLKRTFDEYLLPNITKRYA